MTPEKLQKHKQHCDMHDCEICQSVTETVKTLPTGEGRERLTNRLIEIAPQLLYTQGALDKVADFIQSRERQLLDKTREIYTACVQLYGLPHYENLLAKESSKINYDEYSRVYQQNLDNSVDMFMRDFEAALGKPTPQTTVMEKEDI